MKVASIGGGPAGLYFAILAKKAFPDAIIDIYERNRADDTFGWGVVFSDETLGAFQDADAESYDAICREFRYWGDIETYYGDTCVRSTGHGFCGLSRKRLLQILHARCKELGVGLNFRHEVKSIKDFDDADLVLGADGLNSLVRTELAEHFRPSLDWGECRFSWLGTDKELSAFTFIFRENEHGLWQIHAYPFQAGLSTFIVECPAKTLERSGLERKSEDETVRYFEDLFADHLDGHRLLTNRSIWRTFPMVKNETWHHENVVLLGDSAHTAHFSIGSGTKLAMEDAIALRDAFVEHGTSDIPQVLAAYQDGRWIDVIKLQKAAITSQNWFESVERRMKLPPVQFSFNLMTRSKRITYENLGMRDPDLVRETAELFEREAEEPLTGRGPDTEKQEDRETTGDDTQGTKSVTPPMFVPFHLRDMKLENRVVVSPMCQYSAEDGTVNDWHLMHLGSRATGGAGLIITEMTDVSPESRITYGCAGLWNDDHTAAWRRVVDFVHEHGRAKIGIQLAHAGRKASCNLPWEGDDPLTDDTAWQAIGPSADPFGPGWPTPRAMDRAEMDRVRDAFVAATHRAEAAGFDMIELHFAHGYLLSSFISPASNKRTDEYGGSLENRMRYPLEVFDAVRAAWPDAKPISVRISATDWLPEDEGVTEDESVTVARMLQDHGCDVIDVSTAGNTPTSKPEYGRMYQTPFAERIKMEVGIPVMAVGAILDEDHVNTILAAGRADLCAMARPHLVDPHLTLRAAVKYEHHEQFWPKQYEAAKPRPRR